MDSDYPLLVAIVEEGSLSAAGRRLQLSAPMVSKRLARLEARLGARLIQRSTRRLALTDVGQAFYERVADLLAQQLNRKEDAPVHEQLSEREFQVFLKLARGETAGDIAQALSLSVKTVSTYRTRLLEKMGLSTNSDLTYYALKNRLID